MIRYNGEFRRNDYKITDVKFKWAIVAETPLEAMQVLLQHHCTSLPTISVDDTSAMARGRFLNGDDGTFTIKVQ